MKVTFVRHGNAAEADKDFDRQLTPKGVEQAIARRAALGEPNFDLVITSTAPSAHATGMILAGGHMSTYWGTNKLYMHLEATEERKKLEAMADALGDNVEKYWEHPDWELLETYGFEARDFILDADDAGYENVLVVGHAVLLNAIGLTFMIGKGAQEQLQTTKIPECGGFVIENGEFSMLPDLP